MFVLKKKDNDGYWPRLLKDSKKVHWIKIDWNKWKDEDEEEEEEAAGGAGGAGGMGGADFDQVNPVESDFSGYA
jgi:prostaglandin-E synthase